MELALVAGPGQARELKDRYGELLADELLDLCQRVGARLAEKLVEEPVLCEHGFVEGRGCSECEFYEEADFAYEIGMDR